MAVGVFLSQASYESLESQIASKRLEQQQLEGEVSSVTQRIEALRTSTTTSTSTTTKSSSTAAATATSGKKKKLGKKSSSAASSSKGRSSAASTRNAATAAGAEEVDPAEGAVSASGQTSSSWRTALSGAGQQLVASAGGLAALAVDHRAVILFTLSVAGIFFAGDYASV